MRLSINRLKTSCLHTFASTCPLWSLCTRVIIEDSLCTASSVPRGLSTGHASAVRFTIFACYTVSAEGHFGNEICRAGLQASPAFAIRSAGAYETMNASPRQRIVAAFVIVDLAR